MFLNFTEKLNREIFSRIWIFNCKICDYQITADRAVCLIWLATYSRKLAKRAQLVNKPTQRRSRDDLDFPWSQRFFLIFLRMRQRELQSGEHKSRSGEKEKPHVTLDLNLTFMQTPTVKRVKLIITKGTNSNSASTCLSAVNCLKQSISGKLFV